MKKFLMALVVTATCIVITTLSPQTGFGLDDFILFWLIYTHCEKLME